jgi:hypothetical protein
MAGNGGLVNRNFQMVEKAVGTGVAAVAAMEPPQIVLR